MWIMYRVGGEWRVIVYKLYISVVYKPRVLSWNIASWRCYHKLISLQSCLFSSTLTDRAVFVSLFHSVCLIRSFLSFPFFCFVCVFFFLLVFCRGWFWYLVSMFTFLGFKGCGHKWLGWQWAEPLEERMLENSHEFNFWFWIEIVTCRTEFHLKMEGKKSN